MLKVERYYLLKPKSLEGDFLFMIKKYRVRKNEEFSKIISKRNSLASSSFVLYFDKSKENYSRVGISVSKKLGNAVVRNKIKRQIRMMLSNMYDFDNVGLDLIIIAKNKYLASDFITNQNDLEKLIKKAIMRRHGQGDFLK